jgi:hypothetical protein
VGAAGPVRRAGRTRAMGRVLTSPRLPRPPRLRSAPTGTPRCSVGRRPWPSSTRLRARRWLRKGSREGERAKVTPSLHDPSTLPFADIGFTARPLFAALRAPTVLRLDESAAAAILPHHRTRASCIRGSALCDERGERGCRACTSP